MFSRMLNLFLILFLTIYFITFLVSAIGLNPGDNSNLCEYPPFDNYTNACFTQSPGPAGFLICSLVDSVKGYVSFRLTCDSSIIPGTEAGGHCGIGFGTGAGMVPGHTVVGWNLGMDIYIIILSICDITLLLWRILYRI